MVRKVCKIETLQSNRLVSVLGKMGPARAWADQSRNFLSLYLQHTRPHWFLVFDGNFSFVTSVVSQPEARSCSNGWTSETQSYRKYIKIASLQAHHLMCLLKGSRICHPQICYFGILITYFQLKGLKKQLVQGHLDAPLSS